LQGFSVDKQKRKLSSGAKKDAMRKYPYKRYGFPGVRSSNMRQEKPVPTRLATLSKKNLQVFSKDQDLLRRNEYSMRFTAKGFY
jgi:hypothetical protein